MEIHRVVPAVLRKFEMALADPEREWQFVAGSFVNVADFEAKLEIRA